MLLVSKTITALVTIIGEKKLWEQLLPKDVICLNHTLFKGIQILNGVPNATERQFMIQTALERLLLLLEKCFFDRVKGSPYVNVKALFYSAELFY